MLSAAWKICIGVSVVSLLLSLKFLIVLEPNKKLSEKKIKLCETLTIFFLVVFIVFAFAFVALYGQSRSIAEKRILNDDLSANDIELIDKQNVSGISYCEGKFVGPFLGRSLKNGYLYQMYAQKQADKTVVYFDNGNGGYYPVTNKDFEVEQINKVRATLDDISDATGVSIKTIEETIKLLVDNGIMEEECSGVYLIKFRDILDDMKWCR